MPPGQHQTYLRNDVLQNPASASYMMHIIRAGHEH